LSYVGFFVIIWVTWYHITLHDVRFSHDTIYERACKTVQMVAFVGFALVGSAFEPGTSEGSNTNFRILCYVLTLVHTLLFLQYAVILFFVARSKLQKVIFPVVLNMLVYLAATCVFAFMTPAFKRGKTVSENSAIFSVWWVVLAAETIATVAISCIWRILSFKKTHLVERMGLLTLIVIGYVESRPSILVVPSWLGPKLTQLQRGRHRCDQDHQQDDGKGWS
jgi:low temperature requirement protein LtrA